jgi:hypothetical protein
MKRFCTYNLKTRFFPSMDYLFSTNEMTLSTPLHDNALDFLFPPDVEGHSEVVAQQDGGETINEDVVDEFLRLSLQHHRPTVNRLARSNEVDERLMLKLFRSFLSTVNNTKVKRKLLRASSNFEKRRMLRSTAPLRI